MFVNDVFGLCRGNYFTGDVFGTQVPSTIGGFSQTPFGFNFGANQFAGQGVHPLYSYLFNRAPQSFVPQGFQGFHGLHGIQGFAPQSFGGNTFGGNTFGVNTLGVNTLGVNTLGVNGIGLNTLGLNTIGAQQCLPFVPTHSAFTGGQIGYGVSPYNVANWNWTSPLGFQSQICR